PQVRAWTHVNADLVLANARELDRSGPTGPLHGLPIGIKDIILTHDMPTQYSSPIYRGFHPRMDASCVSVLREAGAEVTELELPSPFEQLVDCQVLIMRLEAQASFLPEYATALERLHPTLREQVENVNGYTREALCHAYDTAAHCHMAFDRLAAPYDCVLTPSTIGEATLGLASTGEPIFNAMWTLLHVPCISIPGFTGPQDLPVGLTLTGPRFSDRRLLAIAGPIGKLFHKIQNYGG
ncbi:MAG: amidase family protein, partial [Pigmentiphaga sp.]